MRMMKKFLDTLECFLNMTVVSVWHLHLISGLEKMNHFNFKASLDHALAHAGSLQQSRRRRPKPPTKCRTLTKVWGEVRFSTGIHWPKPQYCMHKEKQIHLHVVPRAPVLLGAMPTFMLSRMDKLRFI